MTTDKIVARITPEIPYGEPWPQEHTLLSAMHNILTAKADFEVAIARASTWPELRRLIQYCEDAVQGFDHLSRLASKKADRL